MTNVNDTDILFELFYMLLWFFVVRSIVITKARVEVETKYYTLLPSKMECVFNPKYVLIWTSRHWTAWIRRNKL